MSTPTLSRRDLAAAATRRALIGAARAAFSDAGFSAASLGEIAAAAQATTGAIYHHFTDKTGLFRAVALETERDLMEQVMGRIAGQTDLWAALRLGVTATLELASQPAFARILFHEAPAVLGIAEWREIERQFAFGALVDMLGTLKQGGGTHIRNVELTASMLLGALVEAATTMAMAANKAKVLGEARALMLRLIDTLRA